MEPSWESSPLDILNLEPEQSYFCSKCWTCAICHNWFTFANHFPSLGLAFLICKMGELDILRALKDIPQLERPRGREKEMEEGPDGQPRQRAAQLGTLPPFEDLL